MANGLDDERTDCGFPEVTSVFCCFNNSVKISPKGFKGFDVLIRLLSKIDGSVLWLLKTDEWTERNLRNEAHKRGTNPDRLLFADIVAVNEHLGRPKLADLFLDTLSVYAHTTASDALCASLSVVTKIGKVFVSRVARSLLTSIERCKLITTSKEEYETLKLSLASNPEKLNIVKKKFCEYRNSEPLFDTETYTKNFKKAYTKAYQRYANGLTPTEPVIL